MFVRSSCGRACAELHTTCGWVLFSSVGVEHLKSINHQREEEGTGGAEYRENTTQAGQQAGQLFGDLANCSAPPAWFRVLGFVTGSPLIRFGLV